LTRKRIHIEAQIESMMLFCHIGLPGTLVSDSSVSRNKM